MWLTFSIFFATHAGDLRTTHFCTLLSLKHSADPGTIPDDELSFVFYVSFYFYTEFTLVPWGVRKDTLFWESRCVYLWYSYPCVYVVERTLLPSATPRRVVIHSAIRDDFTVSSHRRESLFTTRAATGIVCCISSRRVLRQATRWIQLKTQVWSGRVVSSDTESETQ